MNRRRGPTQEEIAMFAMEEKMARVTRERDEARAEAEKYLQNIEQRQREFAGVVDELDRQRKEKRAWNIDANNLKTQCDLHLQHAKSAERDVTSLANKLDLADHKLAAAQAEVVALRKQNEAFRADDRRAVEHWSFRATQAESQVAELRRALEIAHAALRGVETGCNPFAVPLEPMREVRAALNALEPWVKP